MKKTLLALFMLLVLSCSFAFADIITIEATGTGQTLEEAKENARKELAEKVFPGIIVTETTISTYDDKKSSVSSYSQKSSYSVVGEFPGFDYEIIPSSKNNYVVSTKIVGDSITLNFYLSKLGEQKQNVEYFYEQYVSIDDSESVTKRREALELVVEYFNSYTIYSNIVLKLGGDTAGYELDISKTLAILQQELQSLLDEEENELLKKTSLESINQEILEELEKVSKAQEETKKAQEEANAQAKLQRTLLLNQKLSEMETAEDYGSFSLIESNAVLTIESFSNYVEAVKEAYQSLVEASSQYDALVSDQNAAIEKSFMEEASAIRSRTYPTAYLDSHGNPTSDAKELREQEVEQLRVQKDNEKQEAISIINSKFCDEIQKRYDYYIATVKSFEEKEFYITVNEDMDVLSSSYDGANYSWNLTVEIKKIIVNQLQIKLSYSDLTGEVIPFDKEQRLAFIGSQQYTETVEKYNKLLEEGKYNLAIYFKVTVSDNGTVNIAYTTMDLQFVDGSFASVELSLSSSLDLGFGKSNYLSYDWLKKDTTRIEKNAEPTGNTNDFVDKNSKKKSPVGVSFDFQFSGTFGELINENLSRSFDVTVESRFFISNLFFSVSGNFSFWKASSLANDKIILQRGVFGGIGYRLIDLITFSVRASYAENLGFLINPYVSISYFKTPSLRAEVFGGLYVNFTTGKTALSCGLDFSWRCF